MKRLRNLFKTNAPTVYRRLRDLYLSVGSPIRTVKLSKNTLSQSYMDKLSDPAEFNGILNDLQLHRLLTRGACSILATISGQAF